jgi:AraC family transcriptional regulator
MEKHLHIDRLPGRLMRRPLQHFMGGRPGKTDRTNASDAMARLLERPLPLAPGWLDCGTRLTRPWVRDGFDGYAPAMPGHLIATYHGEPQQCVWTLEGRRLAAPLRPGTVTIVPDGHDGNWHLSGPVAVSHVYLSTDRLKRAADLLGLHGPPDLLDRLGVEDPVSSRLLEILSDEELQGDPAARLLVEQALDLLCLNLLRRHAARHIASAAPAGGLAAWQVRRVASYVDERLEESIGLDELAALVGLSRFHFCTAFRRATGRPPHAYVTERRIERAQALLRNPHLRISDVAPAVGFATPSAFAAAFRRITGMTPRDYRRRL